MSFYLIDNIIILSIVAIFFLFKVRVTDRVPAKPSVYTKSAEPLHQETLANGNAQDSDIAKDANIQSNLPTIYPRKNIQVLRD